MLNFIDPSSRPIAAVVLAIQAVRHFQFSDTSLDSFSVANLGYSSSEHLQGRRKEDAIW